MLIRQLEVSDYNKKYMELLSQLTTAPNVTKDCFEYQFRNLNSNIFVIEENSIIIASGTILIEKKFIHNMASVGHIEDIVVHKDYRNKKLGSIMLKYLINYAKNNKCYKVILNCEDNIISFYEKLEFTKKGTEMALYF